MDGYGEYDRTVNRVAIVTARKVGQPGKIKIYNCVFDRDMRRYDNDLGKRDRIGSKKTGDHVT